MHLRSLQGLALHVANSIFLGDYLTSEGQAAEADLELIRDNGFVVLGADEPSADPARPAAHHARPGQAASGGRDGPPRQCLNRSARRSRPATAGSCGTPTHRSTDPSRMPSRAPRAFA